VHQPERLARIELSLRLHVSARRAKEHGKGARGHKVARGHLMAAVLHHAQRGWKYWLHRRSSKNAMNWEKYAHLLERIPLPTPKITNAV